jgi:hypothetical protein
MQFGVQPAACEQFFVCAALDNSPLIEHQHQIGIVHGRETVGNDETGAPAQQATQRLLDQLFGARIDAAGRLVENEDARVCQIARAIPIN